MYGKVLDERMKKITDKSIGDKQFFLGGKEGVV